jgi:hypothetical protein
MLTLHLPAHSIMALMRRTKGIIGEKAYELLLWDLTRT